MSEESKVVNHYMLTDEKLNEIKENFIKIQNLSSIECNVYNQHLKISLNPHFTSIDNVYNVNGKYISGLMKYDYIYGVYHLDDNKVIYIVYRIEKNNFDIYENDRYVSVCNNETIIYK